ncbi:hypothetical protein [uncultured Roseicyclus sp.]|uniref:TsoY family (seleno)protein n=1 Tax=uncultured Roseicyclus sp. TaxID=543072 RepID=UPI0026048AF3|nr:hypothetical protein [uncultured Roseicyclus sp.]
MSHALTRPADTWSPLYVLASVGAGGLSVTFFMYLMHWVPHPGRTVPVFEDITAALGRGEPALTAAITVALLGIAIFGALNLSLLVWNLRKMRGFRASATGQALANSNAQTQMMALPLALAMSINGGFILGLVFVPGLWSVIEYLFPLAMVAFLAVGWLAFRQLGGFIARVTAPGGFDCARNNSFAQMLPAFALAMTGVGLAAPAALSANGTVAGISLIVSSFFLIAAAVIVLVGLVLGLRSILENGVAAEQAPTLMMIVPITTILGILMLRQAHGLEASFGLPMEGAEKMMLLTRLMSVEVLFALFGLTVLTATGYVRRFLTGDAISPGNYALVCPPVAMSVLTQFWINAGLVGAGLIEKFGTAYWALTAIAIVLQALAIALLVFLHRRHFRAAPRPVMRAA